MKNKNLLTALLIAPCLGASALFAGTPAQDKAFVDKYKAAFEAGDKATLQSFLYTVGANPMALEFYKMMVLEGSGSKIGKIELLDLSPEEVKEAEAIEEGPGGEKTKLPLKPTKKLKISNETKEGSGSSTSSKSCLVAENDGKFVIPVPVAAK